MISETRAVSRILIIVLVTSVFHDAAMASPCVRIVSRIVSANEPAFHCAVYAEPRGVRLLGHSMVSDNNGRSWLPFTPKPDFSAGLPYGYRREPVTAVCDSRTRRLITLFNSLDTPGLDPNAIEPPIAQQTYYLRYRVSEDGGRT